MSIHPTAVIDSGARLGADVSVGPFAVIERQVEVGAGCVIGPHVTILPHTTLGPGCQVHAGAVLGDLPQDLGFKGDETWVRIGARCVSREGVTIHRGTKPGTATEVGDECFLMATAHLAHNVKLGSRVIIANGTMLGGYVQVGERAFISGAVVIHQFVRIGRLAMLGGQVGLSKDVPPFCTALSGVVNTVVGLNVVGMRRAGLGTAERQSIKEAFALLYRSGLNVSQAVERIRAAVPAGPALELAEFVAHSQRGICRFVAQAEAAED